MAKETAAQQKTIARVMHEFKHGDLEGAGRTPVRNRKQAIAIALSEAGASRNDGGAQQGVKTARTRKGKAAKASSDPQRASSQPTRAMLYAAAKRRGIPGRSKMTKAELARALEG